MTGKLQRNIKGGFEASFKYNCLVLFAEAYQFINEHVGITPDWEEENISSNFFEHIDNSKNAISLNINISDEHRLYYLEILTGKKPAKSASRIDFRLTTNWMEELKRVDFFLEAKNLIELDCKKTGIKTKMKANGLNERYIKTGIGKFISGEYPPNGCLVGYVLQGEPTRIVEKINICLQNKHRTTELLQEVDSEIKNIRYCYQSAHEDGYILKHFLLKFSA